jgi:NADH-ubiquinone oxidoreductase chain 5
MLRKTYIFLSCWYLYQPRPVKRNYLNNPCIRCVYMYIYIYIYIVIIINYLVDFIDWNIVTLNGRSIIKTFLFDWMSLLFVGFVCVIIL